MKISNLLVEAGGSIYINKGRSLLTILGVVIGIAAVSAIMGMGVGVDAKIDDQISKLGSTNLTIQSRNPATTAEILKENETSHKAPKGAPESQKLTGAAMAEPSLTQADLQEISGLGTDLVLHVSPKIELTARAVGVNSVVSAAMLGVSESYDEIRTYQISHGTFLSKEDIENNAMAIVIGYQIAADMFGIENPTGRSLSLNDEIYTVKGVLAKSEDGKFDDDNNVILAPYTTVMKQNSMGLKFGTLIAMAKDESSVLSAKTKIESVLLANHKYDSTEVSDFTIQSSAELLDSFTSLTDLFRRVLTGSAVISLLVGGIGIMNIMLVSVTERTREIGLRKAVGAKTGHILAQFLIEAIVLTLLGGVIGIIFGQILAVGITKALDIGITPSITFASVSMAVSISVSIGIIFGIYPAARAAQLDPIDALRYE